MGTTGYCVTERGHGVVMEKFEKFLGGSAALADDTLLVA